MLDVESKNTNIQHLWFKIQNLKRNDTARIQVNGSRQ